MALDLGSLKKAIQSLGNALNVYSQAAAPARSPQEREVLRAGVIQSFEFTYYDPETAEDVYASAGPFFEDAKKLLAALEKRND